MMCGGGPYSGAAPGRGAPRRASAVRRVTARNDLRFAGRPSTRRCFGKSRPRARLGMQRLGTAEKMSHRGPVAAPIPSSCSRPGTWRSRTESDACLRRSTSPRASQGCHPEPRPRRVVRPECRRQENGPQAGRIGIPQGRTLHVRSLHVAARGPPWLPSLKPSGFCNMESGWPVALTRLHQPLAMRPQVRIARRE
jgi:hypothetical protein